MSDKAVASIVSQRQSQNLARATHKKYGQSDSDRKPSRWAHVPLTELFEQQENIIYENRDGTFECGHEPSHKSKSGRCVHIDPALGLWYCSSCKQGGDATTWVMSHLGCSYREATAWLRDWYGEPPGTQRPLRAQKRGGIVWRVL